MTGDWIKSCWVVVRQREVGCVNQFGKYLVLHTLDDAGLGIHLLYIVGIGQCPTYAGVWVGRCSTCAGAGCTDCLICNAEWTSMLCSGVDMGWECCGWVCTLHVWRGNGVTAPARCGGRHKVPHLLRDSLLLLSSTGECPLGLQTLPFFMLPWLQRWLLGQWRTLRPCHDAY